MKQDFLNLFSRKLGNLDLKALSDRHKSEPNISFSQYKYLKRKELDDGLINIKKIYLDLNFWIRLRDAVFDSKRAKPYFKQIFEILKEKVIKKEIICPFSSVLYEELLKQIHLDSRRKTAQIVDILSGNISINPLYYIIGCEVNNLIAETEETSFRIRYSTWSNAIGVLGNLNLNTKADLSPEELIVKKLYYDGLTVQSFQELVTYNDHFKENSQSAIWHADMLNQVKTNSAQETISFPALHKKELESIYITAAKQMNLKEINFNKLINSKSIENLRLLTPLSYIYTTIYSNLQLDRQRIIKPNDYYDVSHASLAIGVCDYFFTERSFCSLIKTMKIDQKFNKVIEYDPKKILEILETI